MRPIIILTAGTENDPKGTPQTRLNRSYTDAIEASGGIALVVPSCDAESAEAIAKAADALCVTGGLDIAPERYGSYDFGHCGPIDALRDTAEWNLMEAFARARKPILGICRGMQALNAYFGGTLTQDIKSELGVDHDFNTVHIVRREGSGGRAAGFGDEYVVNSFHHQAVQRLADCLEPIAVFPGTGFVEAFQHKELPITAVQWHPERMTGEDRLTKEGPDMRPLFDWICGR